MKTQARGKQRTNWWNWFCCVCCVALPWAKWPLSHHSLLSSLQMCVTGPTVITHHKQEGWNNQQTSQTCICYLWTISQTDWQQMTTQLNWYVKLDIMLEHECLQAPVFFCLTVLPCLSWANVMGVHKLFRQPLLVLSLSSRGEMNPQRSISLTQLHLNHKPDTAGQIPQNTWRTVRSTS